MRMLVVSEYYQNDKNFAVNNQLTAWMLVDRLRKGWTVRGWCVKESLKGVRGYYSIHAV